MRSFRMKNHGVCFIAVILFGLVTFNSSYGADHTVTSPDTIPCVLWARGCTPTSASMVLGYWDNYDLDGNTYLGSGRLIDYWRDITLYSDGTGPIRNVPNILDELRIAMDTDVEGGTYTNKIGPGIRAVANTTNGYCYGSTQYIGNVTNDHCWGTIKNEIDNNRPFVWSVGIFNQDGHSLVAWGYTDDKYVITYNTWYCTGRDDWYYAKYDNGQDSDYQYVDTVVPSCWQDSNQLGLYYPAGSESLTGGQTVTVSWRQWGTLIDNVNLYYSTNGGDSWSLIGSGLGSSEGLNYYAWTVPNISTSRVRVKAYGYNSTTYIAGDGTKNNLAITAQTCTYSISPTSRSHGSGAETGSVSVTTAVGCSWSATSNASWITITSGSSGSGNGTVNYSVDANSSTSSRSGTLTIAGQTFTVTQSGLVKPDLIVSSLTGPTTPVVPGQLIGVSEATKNQGSVATTVNTVTRFYWSKDWIYDASDVLLGERTVGPLAAGGISGPVSTSVTVPLTAVLGTYHIIAVADAGNAVAETNETNNKRLWPIRIACIYSISPTSRSHGSGTETGSVSVTSPSGCSWSATSNASWITITSGSSGSGNGTVNYSVAANESTSSRSGTLTIAGQIFTVTQSGLGKPDLIVSSLTGPTTPVVPGQVISLSEATKNQGSVATTVNTVTKFYWSKDATYDGSDVLLGQRTVSPLAAGETSGPVSTPVTVPTSAVSGTFYHILAIADADNAVAETNETNNKKLLPVRISP